MDEKGKLKEPFQRQFDLYEHYIKFIKSTGPDLHDCLTNSYKFWKHVLWLNPKIIHQSLPYLNFSKEDQKSFQMSSDYLFSCFHLPSCPYQRKVRFTHSLYFSTPSKLVTFKQEIRRAEEDIYRFEMVAMRLISKEYLLWKEMIYFANLPFLIETINYSIDIDQQIWMDIKSKFVNCDEERYRRLLKQKLEFVLSYIVNKKSEDMKSFHLANVIDESKKIFENAHKTFASSQNIQSLIKSFSLIPFRYYDDIESCMYSIRLNLEKKIDDLLVKQKK